MWVFSFNIPLILIEDGTTHNVHLGRNFSSLELILSLATNFIELAKISKRKAIQWFPWHKNQWNKFKSFALPTHSFPFLVSNSVEWCCSDLQNVSQIKNILFAIWLTEEELRMRESVLRNCTNVTADTRKETTWWQSFIDDKFVFSDIIQPICIRVQTPLSWKIDSYWC